MILSIDLSLRSAGLVLLAANGEVLDCHLCRMPTTINDTELLLAVEQDIIRWVDTTLQLHGEALDGIVIEGLAFGAVSGNKDIIAGNWWNLKKELSVHFPEVPIGKVPVTSWRAKAFPKYDHAEAKKTHGTKLYLKEGCVDRLPTKVHDYFLDYLKENGYPRAALYDLTDAYWLGIYRLVMEDKNLAELYRT